MYDDDNDQDAPFRDPGGRSALRAGKLKWPCKGCGRRNMLSDADKARHYVCDRCADAAEQGIDY